MTQEQWPSLPLAAWRDTYATLHLWTQIVGKIRLAQSPWTNHSWHVALYLTARGLTTSTLAHGAKILQIDFDFIAHQLIIAASDGGKRVLPLKAQTVADFYGDTMQALHELGASVAIHPLPSEIAEAIPFAEDRSHAAYDPVYANRLWRVLLQAERVMKKFRARFIGKTSPIHFFWGSFDLAVTRFSGREAPPHRGGVPHLPTWVVRDAYSHEVSSAGFWPGGDPLPEPVFYSYAYPEPPAYSVATIEPAAAYYHSELREFVLPYDAVRESASPDAVLLSFLESTYRAAAELGQWDRTALEYRSSEIDNSVLTTRAGASKLSSRESPQ